MRRCFPILQNTVEDALLDGIDERRPNPIPSALVKELTHADVIRLSGERKLIQEMRRGIPARLSPSSYGGDGRVGQKNLKTRLLAIIGCKCEACDTAMPTQSLIHLHHIRLVKDGGRTETGNVILLCPNCHARAHWVNRHLEDHEKPTTRQALVDMLVKVSHL